MSTLHATTGLDRSMPRSMEGDDEDRQFDALHQRLLSLRDSVREDPEAGRDLLLRLKLFREDASGRLVPNYGSPTEPTAVVDGG